MADYFTNFGASSIAGGAGGTGTALNASDTTLLVQTGDGAKFPSAFPFMVLIKGTSTSELVKCTARTSDTLTIVRAQEGTSAATWAVSTTVEHRVTAGNLTNLWNAIPSQADHFIVGYSGQNDSDLSNKIVLPALSGSADIRVAGTNDDEFDQNGSGVPSGWTSFNSLTSADTNTAKSMLHLNSTVNTISGIYKSNPSIPFTLKAKLNSCTPTATFQEAGVFVADAAPPGKLSCLSSLITAAGSPWIIAQENWTNPTTFSAAGVGNYSFMQPPLYFRIVVTAANNIAFAVSLDGYAWIPLLSGGSFLSAIGSVGLFVRASTGNIAQDALFDWIRFS